MKLFSERGEVKVGDIAHYGRKPVVVEQFGVDPQLNTVIVQVKTTSKHSIKLLPYQLGMVIEGAK